MGVMGSELKALMMLRERELEEAEGGLAEATRVRGFLHAGQERGEQVLLLVDQARAARVGQLVLDVTALEVRAAARAGVALGAMAFEQFLEVDSAKGEQATLILYRTGGYESQAAFEMFADAQGFSIDQVLIQAACRRAGVQVLPGPASGVRS